MYFEYKWNKQGDTALMYSFSYMEPVCSMSSSMLFYVSILNENWIHNIKPNSGKILLQEDKLVKYWFRHFRFHQLGRDIEY